MALSPCQLSSRCRGTRKGGPSIILTSRVTVLVEAREAWATELGTLEAVTRSITRSQFVMPRMSPQSPSWEHDADAKLELGPVIAKWLASGVLEYVAWNDRMPTLLQPGRPRARLRFIDSSRTLASPTSSTLIVHCCAAQQHAESVQLSLLHRHLRRLPIGTLGLVRRRAPPDPAAGHHVAGAGSANEVT